MASIAVRTRRPWQGTAVWFVYVLLALILVSMLHATWQHYHFGYVDTAGILRTARLELAGYALVLAFYHWFRSSKKSDQ